MENTQFKVGEKIRAYDFKPMPSELKDQYPDRFVEGEIVEVLANEECYRVKVDVDSVFTKNPRPEVFVPFEAFIEFEGRIVKINMNAKERQDIALESLKKKILKDPELLDVFKRLKDR